jgi:hypothetical protein
MCQTANYKETPMGHELNEVLQIEFYRPSTELYNHRVIPLVHKASKQSYSNYNLC